MLERRRLLGAVAIGVGAALTRTAGAQSAEPVQPAGAEPAEVRLNAPGPEGRLIARRAGLWDVTESVWPSPGATPVVTTGLVAERRMTGTLLQEFIRPPADEAHEDVRRTDLLCFNRLEGRWDYVSFDMRAPVGLMSAWSAESGDGSTIEIHFAPFAVVGAGQEPTGQMLRMQQFIRFQGPDRDVKDQYFTLADGTGSRWLAHQYAYTRRS